MRLFRVGRGPAAMLGTLVLGLVLQAAVSSPVAGQTSPSTPYTVFLPHIQVAYRDVIDPIAIVGIGSSYRAFSPDEAEPGQALVKWRDGVNLDSIARINATYGVQVVGSIQGLGVQILQVAPGATADLLNVYGSLPEVEYAEPNFIAWASPASPADPLRTGDLLRPASLTTNDPMTNQQYSLSRMSVNQAWDTARGDNVVVAVLDTGADFSHPDLMGKFVDAGRDFVNNDDNATDDHGHGTHVSGIIGASTNNGVGIAGVGYNVKILPGKVLSATGSGNHGGIASGITWAADRGAKVINMSLGGPSGSATLEQAINYAWSKGAVVIAAAGNEGTSSPTYPASYTNAIGICATDANDKKAAFSNYGVNVDLCAPGAAILSTVRGGRYESWNGTSMAAPNASGVAALVASAHPDWSNVQIRQALETTADNLGDATYYGRGRINAARAVGSSAPVPYPTATKTPVPPPVYATPTRPPGQPTATPAPNGDYAQQIVALINQARAQNGLPALRYDSRLQNAADFHNRWMRDNNCFSHNCPGEPEVMTRMRNAGYPVASGGENIGKGYQTPQNMMDGWMNSSGHRAAILNTYWPDIGCGYLRGPSGYAWDSYWSCEFASGGSSQPYPTRTAVPTATQPPVFYPSPTPIPTRTPVPTSTVPAPGGGQTIVVTPPSNLVGYVASNGQRGWGDDDLYSGWYAGTLYVAGLQFPLYDVPANANIVGVQLQLFGQTTDYVTQGTAVTWTVRWLDPNFDGQFPNSLYGSLIYAPVRSSLQPALQPANMCVRCPYVWTFNAQQVADFRQQKALSNRISFRIDGPTSGPSLNTMSWDSGWGTDSLGAAYRPRLVIQTAP